MNRSKILWSLIGKEAGQQVNAAIIGVKVKLIDVRKQLMYVAVNGTIGDQIN